MKGIKTREPKKDIHSLDKAKSLAGKMKSGLIRSKDTVQNLSDDGQISADEYAQDKVKYLSEDVASDAARASKAAAKKSYEGGKKLVQQIKQKRHTAEDIKQTAKSTGKQTFKTINRNIKTAGQSAGKAVKTSERTAKTAIKTTEKAAVKAKQAAKAAKKTATAAKRTAQTAKKAAEATAKTAKAAAKATVAAIIAIIAGIKTLVAAIAAGGWVAVVVILVIVMIALIVGSCFGIFYSSSDSSGMTLKTAISDINSEYQSKIDGIKNSVTHDKLKMEGSKANWNDVLAVYAVKTTTDGDNAQEVATMNDEKKEILRSVFWDMTSISKRTETKDEETTLIITVSSKTADEMKSVYHFNAEQRKRLDELLSDENADLWKMVLYGIGSGSTDIVEVALEQLGNVGGQPYWSWYGFSSRVEWCCCFVSWCANECGYIESGTIPKYAVVDDGVNFFKERGQWLDGSAEPEPGMIIFFDWEYDGLGGSGDHTGIVEKVENGTVYTVEGNSGDACCENTYSVGYYEILGYGFYEGNDGSADVSSSDDAATQVWKYLKSYGYSDSVAAGIIGNMMRECGGDTLYLDWDTVGHYNGDEFYGLCQWCLRYTPSGFKGSSIKKQCEYLKQTIQSAFANYGGNYGGITYSEFLKSDTRTAAIAFERVYERCGSYSTEDGRRANNAER